MENIIQDVFSISAVWWQLAANTKDITTLSHIILKIVFSTWRNVDAKHSKVKSHKRNREPVRPVLNTVKICSTGQLEMLLLPPYWKTNGIIGVLLSNLICWKLTMRQYYVKSPNFEDVWLVSFKHLQNLQTLYGTTSSLVFVITTLKRDNSSNWDALFNSVNGYSPTVVSKVEKGGGEGLYSAKREIKWLRGSLIECERKDADDSTDWKNNPDKKKAKKYSYEGGRRRLIECERKDADDPTDWKNNRDKKKAKKYSHRYC